MSLLLPSRPIVVIPELAMRVGLNEAMLLQQVHYWITETTSGIEHDGRRWVYNTIAEWMEQFPFLSESSIKRAFSSLKSQGIIYVEQLSSDPRDKTNFYAINYEHRALTDEVKMTSCNRSNCTVASGHNEPMQQAKPARCKRPKRAALLTESTSESTPKENPPIAPQSDAGADNPSAEAGEVLDFLNEKINGRTPKRADTLREITERLAEGNSAAELKLVAEHRASLLLGDPKMGHMLSAKMIFDAVRFGGYLAAANAWDRQRSHKAAMAEAVEQQRQEPVAGDAPEIDFDEAFDRLIRDAAMPENDAEKRAQQQVRKNGFGNVDESKARQQWRPILTRAYAMSGVQA
ncbi:putative virion protein [Serratia marcescens]|uniref:Virion protein n=1 Tax=Serratia marcescens TaxID=615 RepID=A0AA46K779_SERMA|nr:conserved phage C-terminal domain-containing protein [Serratia marcescens]TQI85667.1 putative virion protein [Serratia marcescens]HEJ7121059.1 conserved phage C-terminal domain-containing protein [Serratia marcescens]